AGAKVDLISGPTALPPPLGASFHLVETADKMHQTVLECLHPKAHFIGVAAVADFKPAHVSDAKMKKQQHDGMQLDLVPGIDILEDVFKRRMAKTVIGFAAETDDLLAHARLKLAKKADMIIANQVGPGLGFEQLDNVLYVLHHGQEIKLETASKLSLACQLVTILADFLKDKNK
ncbi:MAG: phosphopantothenoylcysteine decarboxylase, partial [Gammaproteobacteria bacterium]|nr:phosphopantothenoylcysteine decarboxylase [Gammaproteobacteria bacterium]